MKVLVIDSSGQTAGAAIVSDYISIGEISITASLKHAEILLPIIDTLFSYTGCAIKDMDAVACVCGPGSFTGLRIGAATAMGLAKGANKGLIPVPTLDSMAYNTGGAVLGCYVMPMLDARREQVYTALYQIGDTGFPMRITDYMALPVREALAYLPKGQRVLFLGDGADAYEVIIRETIKPRDILFAQANANRQRVSSAGVCALTMLKNGYALSDTVDIMYIRKPQAEREREKCLPSSP
jgi:tRNA threonylcarbamoyladenosine biosynthesis protein TsaB